MTVILALLVSLALVGASPNGGRAADRRLGDAQLAGQRLIAGFEGEQPPATVRRRIRAGRLGGVILDADNFDSRAEAKRLTRELQAIRRPRGLRDPLLVMTDQEGGLVKRLPGPPTLSAAQMGRAGRSTCRRQGARTARMLRRTAINVDLAPVLDVGRPGSAIEREQRSFGRRPPRVAACADAFAAALERNGIAPTAKHFPGLGRARANTDDAVQRIDASRRALRHSDEAPYRRFIGSGAPGRLVMMSSAVYPSFSDRPAAYATRLATHELRHRLGFEGVTISDSLETVSVYAYGGPTTAAVRSARAGTDLLLFTSISAAVEAAPALREELRRRRERFEGSVSRVLELRSRIAR